MSARPARARLRALAVLVALLVVAPALLISPANAVLKTIYNTSLPEVVMNHDATAPAIGEFVRATEGTWEPVDNPTLRYYWLADGVAIDKARSPLFKVTPDLLGKRLSVRVTASGLLDFPASAVSEPTVPVQLPTIRNHALPVVTGTLKVGHTIGVSTGIWSPSGTHAYQWFADGVAIEGATAKTFGLTPAQAGKKMSIRVTLSQEGYLPGSATSLETVPVEPGTITNVEAPTLVGTFTVGNTVGVDPGSWSPDSLGWTYRWFADDQVIAGATAETLVLSSDLTGKKVKAEVTGSRPGYTPSAASSEASAPVACSLVAPTGVTMGGVTTSRIRVNWTKASCASKYAVSYRLTSATKTKTVVVGDVSTYVLTGLAKARSYRITVASISPEGITSTDSPAIVVKTKS